MNSSQNLSGEELKKLYTENQLTKDLQTQENLRKLLNYELDNIGDTFDSNFDFEIIDFCVEKLKEETPVDDQKLDFLGQKISYESQEITRQKKARRTRKRFIQAAAVAIIISSLLLTGKESFADKFDLIHRLIYRDKGEQLVMESPDSTLSEIEMEEGHLPESLPDEFSFSESDKELLNSITTYSYTFVDTDGNKLKIFIKDDKNYPFNYNNSIEIDNDSTQKYVIDGTSYYYTTNIDVNSISWIYENCIFKICGNYSFDKLDEIRSLYTEEQKNQ